MKVTINTKSKHYLGQWSALEAKYVSLTSNTHKAEVERAKFLYFLKKEKPWTLRKSYTTDAAYEAFKDYSWKEIIRHRLKADTTEVNNTIRALGVCGEDFIAKYGRRAAIYTSRVLVNLPRNVQDKVFAAIDDDYKRAKIIGKTHERVAIVIRKVFKIPKTTRTNRQVLMNEIKRLKEIIGKCPLCRKLVAKQKLV